MSQFRAVQWWPIWQSSFLKSGPLCQSGPLVCLRQSGPTNHQSGLLRQSGPLPVWLLGHQPDIALGTAPGHKILATGNWAQGTGYWYWAHGTWSKQCSHFGCLEISLRATLISIVVIHSGQQSSNPCTRSFDHRIVESWTLESQDARIAQQSVSEMSVV